MSTKYFCDICKHNESPYRMMEAAFRPKVDDDLSDLKLDAVTVKIDLCNDCVTKILTYMQKLEKERGET